MQFINPTMLYGLLAVLIPIAIHLFNFRKYRKVYFSNVRLLNQFRKKTRKRSRLLHYLVLASRIAAIVFLVIAFAQPYFPAPSGIQAGKLNSVSIFLDNSYSMEAAGEQGRLFDDARNIAISIAGAYDADDHFQLLTNDFEGKHQRFVSREEFVQLVRETVLSPSVQSLEAIHARQRDLINRNRTPAAAAYVLSDFQQSTLLSALPDSSASYSTFLVPLKNKKTGNLYIDSCWFSNPVIRHNEVANLQVSLKNVSGNDLEKIPVKLMINGFQRAVAGADIPAGGSATVTLSFNNPETGTFKATVEINDFQVTFDDVYYFTYNVSSSIPVLAINEGEPNPYLSSVFSLDSTISFSNVNTRQVDYSTLPSYRLIVLNELKSISSGALRELSAYVNQGGNLLILPSFEAGTEPLNQLAAALAISGANHTDTARVLVAGINTNHPVFRDVFEREVAKDENINLPVIRKHVRYVQASNSRGETLITLENGDPLLIAVNTGNGTIYQSAIPFTDIAGNFPRHAVFVPSLLNIAFQSDDIQPFMHYTGTTVGIRVYENIKGGDQVFRLKNLQEDHEFVPEMRKIDGVYYLFVKNQANKAGFYDLAYGDQTISILAFNFNRKESDLRVPDMDALEKLTANIPGLSIMDENAASITSAITGNTSGKKLWKWFIAAAMLMLLAESLLLRFFQQWQVSRAQSVN